jgi:DNA-binding NarL/FixJ family response regulator
MSALHHSKDPADSAGQALTSVGIVDDDAIVRAWLRLSLAQSEFRVAGEATTAADALELVRRRRPQLLLIDYRLPDRRGTELVQLFRQQGITTPVLLITAAPEPGLNEAIADAGGQGVVLKQSDPQTLLTALRSVASGAVFADSRHPRRPSGHARISSRERAALRAAAEGRTNPEIALQLGLGRESVKTLLSRAFTKLGARNRMEAVRLAREQGLL